MISSLKPNLILYGNFLHLGSFNIRMSLSIQKKVNQLTVMNMPEKIATGLLAGLFSLRMLGLFMLLPVLALYTHEYQGANPQLIGIALGIYGLTQAIFQIPFGLLSDRIGRKPVIFIGLILLAIGSLVAASATSIYGLILGRALQGSGAIGATLLAFVADTTRESVRSRAMAIIGITIGFSFGLAMIIGPLLESHFKLQGIFGFTFLFAVIGIILLYSVFPKLKKSLNLLYETKPHQSIVQLFSAILWNRNLQCLNVGILCLHALFSSCFLFIPRLILEMFPLSVHQSWKVYAPVLIGAVLLMTPFVRRADKTQKLQSLLLSAIFVFALSILGLLIVQSKIGVYLGLTLFFAAFNILESLLPSFVSQLVESSQRGTALGVYSTSQFLGIFLGGAIGGSMQQTFGLFGIGLWCMILVLLFAGAIGYVKRY